MKLLKIIGEEYKSRDKIVRFIFLILSFCVLLCLVREIVRGDVKHILTVCLTLFLFLIPSILHRKFKIVFPSALEIMIYILVFSSEILGEVMAFYVHIKIFDTILHLLYGFVMTAIGFSLIDILNNNLKAKLLLVPKYLVLFGFCYGMSSGLTWEILEYTMDKCFNQDMQKDTVITEINSVLLNEEDDNKVKTIDIDELIVNEEDYIEKYGGYIDIGLNDTMKDLIVNMIGTIVFSMMGHAYLKGKCKVTSKFLLKKKDETGKLL